MRVATTPGNVLSAAAIGAALVLASAVFPVRPCDAQEESLQRYVVGVSGMT